MDEHAEAGFDRRCGDAANWKGLIRDARHGKLGV